MSNELPGFTEPEITGADGKPIPLAEASYEDLAADTYRRQRAGEDVEAARSTLTCLSRYLVEDGLNYGDAVETYVAEMWHDIGGITMGGNAVATEWGQFRIASALAAGFEFVENTKAMVRMRRPGGYSLGQAAVALRCGVHWPQPEHSRNAINVLLRRDYNEAEAESIVAAIQVADTMWARRERQKAA